MAHKKGGGSSRNGRDSNAQHLGVKVFGGRDGSRRLHHRAPARDPDPSGRRGRQGQRRHAVRPAAGCRGVPRFPRTEVRVRPARRVTTQPARILRADLVDPRLDHLFVAGVRRREVAQVRPHVPPLAGAAERSERTRRPASQSGLRQRHGSRFGRPERRRLREVERDPPDVAGSRVRHHQDRGALHALGRLHRGDRDPVLEPRLRLGEDDGIRLELERASDVVLHLSPVQADHPHGRGLRHPHILARRPTSDHLSWTA